MTRFCACCRITVPQYGHRALAFTSSGAPQHSKQSKSFLQSGILSPIFFYAGYPLSIIYFAPAHGKSDFPFRRTLEHKAAPPGTRPDGAALFDVLVRSLHFSLLAPKGEAVGDHGDKLAVRRFALNTADGVAEVLLQGLHIAATSPNPCIPAVFGLLFMKDYSRFA